MRELKDLVVAYAKQETIEPLKGMGRYVGFGLAGALLMGTGVVLPRDRRCCVRCRSNRGWAVHGNWSWVPYVIVVVVAGRRRRHCVWMARTKRSQKHKRSTKP